MIAQEVLRYQQQWRVAMRPALYVDQGSRLYELQHECDWCSSE